MSPGMTRRTLDERRIHPSVREKIATYRTGIVDEAESAIAKHDVVVIGMRQNPFPRRTRRLLDGAGIPYHYLEYGSYLSQWRERLPLKIWTGWPTFPMIFVKGQFIGGFEDVQRLQSNGELSRLIASPRQ
jgi:monothiol glutaredoxin